MNAWLSILSFRKDAFLNKKTKSSNEGDESVSESTNMNKKSCSSYVIARDKPTQEKS